MRLFAVDHPDRAGDGARPGLPRPGPGYGRFAADGLIELADGSRRSQAELVPAAAVPWPGKVICVGLNYRDHVEEQHLALPDRPLLFSKFANAVVASGRPVVRPPGTRALDLEVELGVVIGRRARGVSRDDAMAHVAGYVVVNDVSARDWQGNRAALGPGERGDGQWLRAKGSDTFLPVGPVFASADEIPDPQALRLRSWRVPGSGPDAGRELPMQDGTTADMIFDVPTLLAWISTYLTLEPGDLIATGTPSGVGVFRDPPVYFVPGDRMICEIDGLGRVDNPVVERTAEDTGSFDRSPGSEEAA